MENLKITEDLSSIFPIDKIFIKREEIQNFYSKNHGHSHDNNQHGHSHNQNQQHGHSHNGKPCDGHSHNQNQKQHAHSHKNSKPLQYTQSHTTEEDDEECIDDEEHHGHSHNHNQKNHGHSHNQNQQVSQKGHSHSHHEENDEDCSNEDEEHHGHSHNHNQKNHGHSHDHNQHGHSHEKNQHGHSHDHNQHGHSHDKKPEPQQHGHSHNGKPCDGNHKAPILFNLINLSTSAFLGISKLKLYLSNEKKKTTFEGWWKEQKQNNNAKQLIEERVESLLESSIKSGELEKTDMIQLAPELFDIPSLLGDKKDEKIEDSKSYDGDLLALINYFIKFNDDCRLKTEGQGSTLSDDFFRIVCFCALIIPLIEKATGESLSPNKTVKKNFNAKCEKHQEKYLVHPYTSEWTCFQCNPSAEDLKVINYFSNIHNQLRHSIAQVSGMESLCSDPQCKHCPYFVNLGFHEKRGMLRYLSNNYEVVCAGCGKLTGKQKSGLLLVEINQKHSANCKDKRYQEKVPSANCGCKVHTSFFLICSLKCHKKLKLPEYEQTKTLYSQASQKIVVYSSGPLVLGCFHYNDKGQLIEFEITPNKNVLETACNVCGKSDSKSCGRCKSTFYCSVECQKKDWPNHKLICKQN